MNTLKTGRPSVAKAIQLMEKEEEELLGIMIPTTLKKRLKMHTVNNKTSIKAIVAMLIENYLEEEEMHD